MNDDEIRALVEQAYEISEMVKTPGWFALVQACQTVIHAKQRYLLEGKAKSQEEYRAKAGELLGMRAVLDVPEMMAKKALEHQEIAKTREG